MFYLLLPTVLVLFTPFSECSEHKTSVSDTLSSSVSHRSPNIDYKPTSPSDLPPTSTTWTKPRDITDKDHVTLSRRVTEYPRNDEDMVDRTIYVRGISEAFVILTREIELYVSRGHAKNYSLMGLQKNLKLKHLISVSDLLSKSEVHHDTLKLHFGQKLLLYNKAAYRFETWWTIKLCSDLNETFISKCRVVNIDANNVLINVPSDEIPKIILLHNKNISISNISGSASDDMQCFSRKYHLENTLRRTNCHHTSSHKYLLLTITSSTRLLLNTSTTSPHLFNSTSTTPLVTVYFNVLSVSQIISVNHQTTPTKLDVPVNLVRDRTSLLIEFTSSHFTHTSSNIYIESCSTYDGKSSRKKELCELTDRNVSLNTRSFRKLLPHENVILNLQTARSASYLLSYYPSEEAKIEKESKVVEVVTYDKRFLTSVCFNETLEGCRREVYYFTALGNASFDRKLLNEGKPL